MSEILKNTGSQSIFVTVIDSSTGAGKESGVSFTYTAAGGSQMALTNAPTHKGNGQYEVIPTQAETNVDCFSVGWYGSGVVPNCVTILTTTKRLRDLQDLAAGAAMTLTEAAILALWHQAESAVVTAGSIGLKLKTGIPAIAPGSNGGLPTTNGSIINQTVGLTAGQSIGITGDLSATMKTSVQTAADAAVTANTKIVAIEADTNELQTNQGNWLTATGFSTLTAQQVWEYATRILTAGTNIGFPDASSIATAVWSAGTRTLSSFGTLVADTAAAVWAYATRILTGNDNLSIPTAEQIGVAVMTTPTSGTDAGDLGYIIEAGYTLMSTGDGVKVGSIANNAITSNAVAAAALNGKGDWNTVAPDNASAAATLAVVQCDKVAILVEGAYWMSYRVAGTATEIMRKQMFDANGDPVTSITTPVAAIQGAA